MARLKGCRAQLERSKVRDPRIYLYTDWQAPVTGTVYIRYDIINMSLCIYITGKASEIREEKENEEELRRTGT